MSTERRYTESELNALFARAARRQERAHQDDETYRGCLTLAEAQRVAAEAGIDPAHVAAAAAELEHADAAAATLLGAPVVVERARVLPGPVSEEAWARMVAEARRAFDNSGSAGQVGATREWTAVGTGASRDVVTRLVAEPAGDGTRLVLHQSARGLAVALNLSGALTALIAVVTGVFAFLNVDPAETVPAFLIVLALTVAMLGGLQVGLRIWAGRQDRKFEALLDRLELIARDAREVPIDASVVSGPTEGHVAPRLTLDAREDAPPEAAAPLRRRTRT